MKKFKTLVGIMGACMALAGCGEDAINVNEKEYMNIENENRFNSFL